MTSLVTLRVPNNQLTGDYAFHADLRDLCVLPKQVIVL